jgi:N utilization substance protein B
LFKNYLICNEQFFDLLCEKKLEWESDYDIIAQNSLKRLKEYDGQSEDFFNESFDKNYITSMFLNTINNDVEFMELINSRIQNWDMDRVALMDIIIIKMGLTELLYCPEIPVNVTLNEYVELAKEFSTQKSKLFVNGLLDKLMVDLRAKGRIKKIEANEDETEKINLI